MSRPNINQPHSWKKYHNGLCDGCSAACCTMPVELKASDLVRLGLASADELENSLKKTVKRLQKEGVVKTYRAGTGIFTLAQKPGGDCIFLDKNRLCMVYDKRPETCRNFPKVSSRPGFCPASPKV